MEIYVNLAEKLSKLQWLLGRHRMQRHAEHGPTGDPSRGQGRVLAMLRLQPAVSTRDLSYLLGIRQQSLSELLAKLEKGGFITRTPSEQDRRVIMVSLTEKGRAVEQRRPEQDLSDIFDCLTKEEVEQLDAILGRVIASLESKLDTDFDHKEMEDWMRAARSRMDGEQYERLLNMRRGGRKSLEGLKEMWEHGFGMARGAWEGFSDEGQFDGHDHPCDHDHPYDHDDRGHCAHRGDHDDAEDGNDDK